jgi:HAMP domain-containing protein
MSLRFRFFLPLLLCGGMLIGYVYWQWLPELSSVVERQDEQQLAQKLTAIGEDFLALRARQGSESAWRFLERLAAQNRNWVRIELLDDSGRVVYRADGPARPATRGAYSVRRTLQKTGWPTDVLVLTVDADGRRQALAGVSQHLLGGLFIILLALAALIALVVELSVRRPLTQLATSAARLTQGDFTTLLPRAQTGEMSVLISRFKSIRDAMQRYQSDLSFQRTIR